MTTGVASMFSLIAEHSSAPASGNAADGPAGASDSLLPLNHLHFPILDREHGSQIINVLKDKLQVAEPARPLEEVNAMTAQTCRWRSVAPAADDRRCLRI